MCCAHAFFIWKVVANTVEYSWQHSYLRRILKKMWRQSHESNKTAARLGSNIQWFNACLSRVNDCCTACALISCVQVPKLIQTLMQRIQVFVNFVHGGTRTVEVKTSDTVQNFLMKMEQQECMDKNDCYFTFCGKTLHRFSTVSECGIRSRSTLHMTTRLHGGMHKTVSFIHSLPMICLMSSRHTQLVMIRT